ncbi:MAG: transglutaminase-like cysteine peptidase [Gammaproteobacteria bacterium]
MLSPRRQTSGRKRGHRILSVVVAVLSGTVALLAVLPGPAQSSPPLFGTTEQRYERNSKLFPKWESMRERATMDDSKVPACKPNIFLSCFQKEMDERLPKLRTMSPRKQVDEVHQWINRMQYEKDSATYGARDYWAARHESQEKDKGDCEDYAISKYYVLKKLGFPTSSLRIAAVKDTNLKIGHAILIVYLNGEVLVLDNRIKRVVTQDRIVHYLPVYTINEENWWRHRPR